MTPFQTIDNLTINKITWEQLLDENKKSYNVFQVNRFLSMDKDYIELVNTIQFNYIIPKEHIYKLYLKLLPKEKRYTKYIKKQKDDTNKDLLKILAKYFETSTKEAKEYLKILSEEKVGHILYSLGYSQKEIKKLL